MQAANKNVFCETHHQSSNASYQSQRDEWRVDNWRESLQQPLVGSFFGGMVGKGCARNGML
jgi:hypothetical protein